MFAPAWQLGLGLVTGIVFGFLLQKGRVAKHGVIVRQLLLSDFTVVKIMLTAVAVGAVGYWGLVAAGEVDVDVKPFQLGGVLVGAVLFGAGLAVLGYCPGTTVAAVGEGHRDAIAGLVGMLVGAVVFVAGFPLSGEIQKAWADWGKVTLPDVTGTSPLVWVVALALCAVGTALLPAHRGSRYRGPQPANARPMHFGR